MKITVDWDVLQREHIPIGDFLTMLIGYYETDYGESRSRLTDAGIIKQMSLQCHERACMSGACM